jgi:hypothetical protein
VTRLPTEVRCAMHMTASASFERDSGAGRRLVLPALRNVPLTYVTRRRRGQGPAAPLTAVVRVLRAGGPTSFGMRAC